LDVYGELVRAEIQKCRPFFLWRGDKIQGLLKTLYKVDRHRERTVMTKTIRIIALMVASQLLIPATNGLAASKGAGASGTGGNCMYCILKCHGYLTAEPDCVKICNDNGCSWPAAKAQVSNLSKQKN